MSITSFPIPTTSLALIPTAAAFSPGAHLVAIQDGAEKKIPLSALPSSAFDVRSYGATGNGTTDDSAAIAACFAAAPSGGTVVFPNGTYLMRSMVTIAVDHLTIIGQGAKIISDEANQDRKFTCIGRTGIKFRGLRFDGGALTTLAAPDDFDTYSPRTEPGTIHFSAAIKCSVSECDFTGVNWPITILGACEAIDIRHNTFAQYFAAVYAYFSGPDETAGNPQPKRVSVCHNHFFAGKYRAFSFPNRYDDRDYSMEDRLCSGAIKFRGEHAGFDKPWFESCLHLIEGNTIRDPGQMGIEIQGCANDTAIVGNLIASASIGISLSVIQRVTVTGNTIKDTIYTAIEVDGWNDAGPTDRSNDAIVLADNVIDGRDDWGRPVNFVDNFGIVVSNRSRHVAITGGTITYCKTGIVVSDDSSHVTITGVRISTNEESGTGNIGTYLELPTQPYVQGILLKQASDVEITGCRLQPSGAAWQRMINLIDATNVRIRSCTVIAQNACVYIHNSSEITVESSELVMGATPGGSNRSFIVVDSTNTNCANLLIRGNRMRGTVENGVSLYCPANTIGPLIIERNDTRSATVSNARFVNPDVSGAGVLGLIVTRHNLGTGNSEQTNIDVPVRIVDGNAGAFTDTPVFETLLCEWDAVVNLQTAVGYSGKRKTIVFFSSSGTQTINATGGQTINGASSVTLRAQWDRVELTSNGSNWIITSASPGLSFPIQDAHVKKSLKVDGNSAGVAIKQIASVVIAHDFGTIAAYSEATHGFTIDCASGTTDAPNIIVNFFEYFDPSLNIRAYIDSANHATLRIFNPGGSGYALGTRTFRATCIEFVHV